MMRTLASSVIAPADGEAAEPAPGQRLGTQHKYRLVATGLGFSVIVQTTVSLLATAVPVLAPAIAKRPT